MRKQSSVKADVVLRRADEAMRWLRPQLSNPVFMKNCRRMLSRENVTNIEKMSNQQVAARISLMLFQHKLMLVSAVLLKREPAVIVVERAPKRVIEETRSSAREQAEIAPAPTVIDNTDHNAQAVTLVAAAKEGVPFCEECEK